jgi:hypothetical protein
MERQQPGTPEQAWCGTWWRCTRCTNSTLLPSIDLTKHLQGMRATAAA